MDYFTGPKLLDFKNSPPHLQFNKYVLTGYRPISTYRDCLRSLFYLHNEFGNIYTHGALPIIHITLLCYPSSRRVAMLSNVHRLQSFAWQVMFRFILLILRLTGAGRGSPASLRLYLTMDTLALLGGLVNIFRLPERVSPGRFDYWFNSHQIMHIMVILSIMYLHWGMLEDLTWLKGYHCPGE
uniref:Progestin and adipoQ receptor family member 4-like n=1 Tax=Sinocyclocheilus anshuiensis TaxID=1608454 RepID=A0A671LNM3_9TELE